MSSNRAIVLVPQKNYQPCRCSLALNAQKSSQPLTCSNSDQNQASKVHSCLQQLDMQRAMVLYSPQDLHLASLTAKTKRSAQGQMLRRRGLARLRNQLLFRYHSGPYISPNTTLMFRPSVTKLRMVMRTMTRRHTPTEKLVMSKQSPYDFVTCLRRAPCAQPNYHAVLPDL